MDKRSKNRRNEHAHHGWVETSRNHVQKPGQTLMECPAPCKWFGWVDSEATK